MAVVMHIRYLPIADRYDMHAPHQCDEGDRQCRETRISQGTIDLLRTSQEIARNAYRLAQDLYDNGSN